MGYELFMAAFGTTDGGFNPLLLRVINQFINFKMGVEMGEENYFYL